MLNIVIKVSMLKIFVNHYCPGPLFMFNKFNKFNKLIHKYVKKKKLMTIDI